MAENEIEDANAIAMMIAMGGPNEVDEWCKKNNIDLDHMRTVVQRFTASHLKRPRGSGGLMMHGVALGYELARLRFMSEELGTWTLKAVETENGYRTAVLGDPLAEGDEVRVREVPDVPGEPSESAACSPPPQVVPTCRSCGFQDVAVPVTMLDTCDFRCPECDAIDFRFLREAVSDAR